MRALPVEFLLRQLGGLGFLVGFAVVFALLALVWGGRHLGRWEADEEMAEERVVHESEGKFLLFPLLLETRLDMELTLTVSG